MHRFSSLKQTVKASLACGLLIFTANLQAKDSIEIASSNDFEAPEIDHNLTEDVARDSDGNVIIKARVTDEFSINSVSMFFRDSANDKYRKRPMNPDTQTGNSTYQAMIPKTALNSDRIEYYFEADDMVGNKKLKGLEFSPLKRRISELTVVEAAALEVKDMQENSVSKEAHSDTFSPVAPMVWIPGI